MKVLTHDINTHADVAALSAKDLLAVYNKLTGKSTTKFASKDKGVAQTWGAAKVALATSGEGAKPAATPTAAPKATPKAPKAPKVKAEKKVRGIFNVPADAEVQPHREGTKRAKVLEMLGRPEGATLEEVRKANDWDVKTAYDGVRLIHTYLGYGLRTSAEGRIHLVRPK